MNRLRVMFVDDEVAVLEGLRDLLRKNRNQWDMVFAQGGIQALEELSQTPCQIVISDMRMPGMDGAELLSRVQILSPDTIRMMLSGHAEREALIRAMPVAHQFLGKPCDAQALRTTIAHAERLIEMMKNESIRSAAGGLSALPSVPSTYVALTRVASDPSAGISDIADVIASDPAMAAKVLQLVNSAYFGVAQKVFSIKLAVTYLGVELLKGLALTSNLFSSLDSTQIPGFSAERFRVRSLLAAKMAARLAPASKESDEAFASALLQDVGSVILALRHPEHLMEIADIVARTRRPLHCVEREVFGVSHAEVGAYLLGAWGLPASVVDRVAYHHQPSLCPDGPNAILSAVHVAAEMSEEVADVIHSDDTADHLDLPYLERAGMSVDRTAWRSFAHEELRSLTGVAAPGRSA